LPTGFGAFNVLMWFTMHAVILSVCVCVSQ